jgi:RimJ/RimL family protein N-acetyltransferase
MPIEGDLVILREERKEDMPLLLSLRNDLDTQGWSKALPTDYTLAMYVNRFQSREFTFDPREGRFVIEDRASGEAIGTIGYSELHPRLSATIGIAIAKSAWGGGHAYESQELLLRFLFAELGLRVVRLWTQSGNPRAVHLAEKAGFQVSVRMREAIFKGGKRYDTLMMDMLREEYYTRHPELKDELPSP